MAAVVEALRRSDMGGLNQIEVAAICFVSRCFLLLGSTAPCSEDRKHGSNTSLLKQVREVLLERRGCWKQEELLMK